MGDQNNLKKTISVKPNWRGGKRRWLSCRSGSGSGPESGGRLQGWRDQTDHQMSKPARLPRRRTRYADQTRRNAPG